MDEDNDIFEMFLAVMDRLRAENPDGRIRIISRNPRYATSSPGYIEKGANAEALAHKTKHIER